MNRIMQTLSTLAFVLLAAWVVMAGLGLTTMPDTPKKRAPRPQRAKGDIWAVPVVAAPAATDGIGAPYVPIM